MIVSQIRSMGFKSGEYGGKYFVASGANFKLYGGAMYLNMAQCCVKVYIFFNKNNNIAVVMTVTISGCYT